jgi:hypothetical protein
MRLSHLRRKHLSSYAAAIRDRAPNSYSSLPRSSEQVRKANLDYGGREGWWVAGIRWIIESHDEPHSANSQSGMDALTLTIQSGCRPRISPITR